MYGKSRRAVGPAPGTQEHIQPFRKDRSYGLEGIHRILRQATGGTSEREHTLPDFLWNHDPPVPSHNQLQNGSTGIYAGIARSWA